MKAKDPPPREGGGAAPVFLTHVSSQMRILKIVEKGCKAAWKGPGWAKDPHLLCPPFPNCHGAPRMAHAPLFAHRAGAASLL